MLGKLARYLRMVGFDAAYCRSQSVSSLIAKAHAEGRLLLTRRTRLDAEGLPAAVYFVKSNYPSEQLQEVVTRFALALDQQKVFTRCLLCNEHLATIDSIEVQGKVPEYVLTTTAEFSQCPSCKKIYWKGTHYEHMLRQFNNLLAGAGSTEKNGGE